MSAAMVRTALPLGLLFGVVACDEPPDQTPCDCRGDEACVDELCVPWHEAPLEVDFDISYDGRTITCRVDDGGFPRDRVDSLRFTFGDGFSGYGEDISHEYAVDGVYPVDLVVRLEGYRTLRASRLAMIQQGGAPDSRVIFTVDEIPGYLNGSAPYRSDNSTPNDPKDDYDADFHLLLPQAGFTVDVALLDAPGADVELSSLRLVADRPLGDGAIPAGTDLSDRLIFGTEPRDRVRRGVWTVEPSERFPTGLVTLTLTASDAGSVDHSHDLMVEIVELAPEIDPFDRPMVWLMRFDMDWFTISPNPTGGIEVATGSDGAPDFAQELAAIGARGSDAAANAAYERWIVAEILAEIRRYYLMAPDGTPRDRISMTIVASGEPGAPDPADFAVEGGFSMMRFGGTLENNFGRSLFAEHNEARVDDTSAGLGVATATIIHALATTAFVAEELFPIAPDIGIPVGDHPADAIVLSAEFDRYDPDNDEQANARYDDLARIARQLALAIGAVAAHEMGHAMGLIPNEPPPSGFFGNRGDVEFIRAERTNSHHVNFPFVNLMQAGGNAIAILAEALERVETPDDYNIVDLVRVLALENRLSPYSRAYFQRTLTYGAF